MKSSTSLAPTPYGAFPVMISDHNEADSLLACAQPIVNGLEASAQREDCFAQTLCPATRPASSTVFIAHNKGWEMLQWCLGVSQAERTSTAPAAPNKCPMAPLVDDTSRSPSAPISYALPSKPP